MSNSKDRTSRAIPEIVRDLLSVRDEIAAGEVARAAAVTRQAAHYHLARMVHAGELEQSGRGRGSRYRSRSSLSKTYHRHALEEHKVWNELVAEFPPLRELPENVETILHYAFTEMLNNAIDHSEADEIRIKAGFGNQSLSFEISESGVGLFRRVREVLGLSDDIDALQQVSKGKTTTDPEHHTGEGIFFTSKAVDLFFVESSGIRWTIDNLRNEHAIGESSVSQGTRVQWQLAVDSRRDLTQIFDEYTDEDFRFSKTRTFVKLYQFGVRFVSRSEAKRLTKGLERFSEVIVDFTGVSDVGQGFADELFRVWPSTHRETRLVPVNMAPPVERMIRRILA